MDLETLRHSCSHIMAGAVQALYPDTKFGIGPAIENGFYYDFEIPAGIKEEDLPKIEALMQETIAKDSPFIHETWPVDKALAFFKEREQTYKIELINELAAEQETISIYKHADFVDVCRGPHVPSAGAVKHFKLLSTSGAYWRGDEKNAQLVRIYGTVFMTAKDLKNHLTLLEEAKRRDHRLLGKQLNLFEFYHNQAGAGLPFYLPGGALLKRIIEDWEIREHYRRGYVMVGTPHIMDKKLWEKSGHLEYYEDYMYDIQKENQEFILKPMNCPGHILIYKSQLRSWRDLPLRMFELGTVYRFEKSGVLHGLLRVRGFTQDDAHIFCKREDLSGEIEGVLDFVKEVMRKFGFSEFKAELSTRPEKFIGDIQDWELSEKILEEVLKNKEFRYTINKGDGAFYGPKIDIKLNDALGREWQCGTIQLDFNVPKRFALTYRDKSGQDVRAIMVHRALLGSLERFIATLVEHYAGKFPLWLAPVQASVLSITQDLKAYVGQVRQRLEDEGFRVTQDVRDETLQRKIREKELQKTPYLVILGKKEEAQKKISIRKRGRKNMGTMDIDTFIDILKEEVRD